MRCSHDSSPGCHCGFRSDTRIGQCQGKENRPGRHRANHFWCDRAPGGQPNVNISIAQSIAEGPANVSRIRPASDVQLGPVHVASPVTIKNAEAITDQDMLEAGLQQETGGPNSTGTRAVDHHTNRLFRLAHELERIGEGCQDGDGSGVLFSMQYRDIHCPCQVVGHGKTAGGSNAT